MFFIRGILYAYPTTLFVVHVLFHSPFSCILFIQNNRFFPLLFFPFSLRIIPRTLRFKQPAGTSRGVYYDRKVWYILLTSTDPKHRFRGLGECAPLHDLSCDYDEHYEERLRSICKEVEQTQNLDSNRLRCYPSILFGLQMAFRSALGSVEGDYLKLFQSSFTRGEKGIPINGLVWMGTYEEMCKRMEEKLAAGFRCVKLKIGAIDFESELALIKQLRQRYDSSTVELRVDANGAFSPLEAMSRLAMLSRYDIHSIEQPIRKGQWQEMARLCAHTPLPIALDEELIGINDYKQKVELLDTIRPQYIILKPTLHGAFTGAAEWIKLARERNIGYWITSALESNVGLNAIAQWSATVENSSTLMPQGLGTGNLFVKNFDGAPLHIKGDCLWYGDEKQRCFLQEIKSFKEEWKKPFSTMKVHTSGSTGIPKTIEVEKAKMCSSAMTTVKALGLRKGNTALLCMPLRYIAGQMMIVRSLVANLTLIPVAPTSHPFASLRDAPDFAAITPMQAYETLRVPRERALMRRTRCLIIGGGPVGIELATVLKTFPNPVYSTYGMTETLSHIALRRVNGPQSSEYYTPLEGVNVSQTFDERLVVDAPAVCDQTLITNDRVEVLSDGRFRVLGRVDNVVCSGSIKLQIEQIERKLSSLHIPFVLSSVPNERLGEMLVMLYEGRKDQIPEIEFHCRQLLDRYEVPRAFLPISSIPLTETGKPARAEIKKRAQSLME